MKTKKFLMTSLLVMGMIIAKAANGFPPELVLVSQPVLTYNANSVTVYYDIQNIGDYTYRGDIYIYLDPDDGRYYSREYLRVCPGRIKRVAVTIPAYRSNPSWVYTVMPYYELDGELYSFTTFEYFEPVSFCWYGYRNEPWVVIHVGPRPRHYHRPNPYRFYYDGYYPIAPPPPGGYPPGYFNHMKPLDPHHHTYGYHHSYGGYPANYHPEGPVPGYNTVDEARVVRPGNSTPGSMSSNGAVNNNSNNSNNTPGSSTRNTTSSSGNNGGVTTRPSTSGNTNNSGSVTRPSNNSNNSGTSSSERTGTTGRTENRDSNSSNSSSSVSRPSTNNNAGTSGSGRSGNSNSSSTSRSGSSNNNRSGSSSSSSSGSNSSRGSSNTSSRGSNTSSRSR